MNLKIALFGIAREIVGQSTLELSAPEGQSAQGLLAALHAQYPALAGLSSLAVAVNNEYAAADTAAARARRNSPDSARKRRVILVASCWLSVASVLQNVMLSGAEEVSHL